MDKSEGQKFTDATHSLFKAPPHEAIEVIVQGVSHCRVGCASVEVVPVDREIALEKYKDIYERYEAEVLALVPELREWWDKLEDSKSEGTKAERWPFNYCAHPRFIAVYRRYFIEVAKRTIELESKESDADLLFKPNALLRDHFLIKNTKLMKNFGHFLYVPIGADDQALIAGGE